MISKLFNRGLAALNRFLDPKSYAWFRNETQLANARADIEAHVTQARCAAVNLGYPDKTLEDAVRAVEQQKILDGIAAKEAEREQRECLSLITESLLVMPGRTLVEAVKDLIELHGTAKKKVEDLEKEVTRQQGVIRLQNKTMEDHVSRGVHESMVADLRAKVDGLEKRLAEQDAEHEKLVSDKRRAEARIRAWEERTGETGPSAPRIVGAKLEPTTVDGKTPGQVGFEGYRDARHKATGEWSSWEHELTAVRHDWWGEGANAVLRTFGSFPSGQTTQTNAVEASGHEMIKAAKKTDADPIRIATRLHRGTR